MARAKKSAQLLQKLNQSLGEDSGPAAARVEPAPAAAPIESGSMPVQIIAEVPAAAPTPETPVPVPPVPAPATAAEPLSVNTAVAAAATVGKRARAEAIVRQYVPFAIGAGIIPVPGLDWAAIAGLQLKVLAALSQLYGVPFSRREARLIVTSLLGSLGGTVVATGALGSVVKFVPGFGTLLGLTTLPVASGVVTYAIGHLAIDHFEVGGTMMDFDLDVAHRAWDRKLEEAKRALGH